jgi:hypothetical protein
LGDLDQGATAEIDAIDTPEVSMEDTIRDTLRDITDRDTDNNQVEDDSAAAPVVAELTEDSTPDDKLPQVADSTAVAEVSAPNTWKKEAAEAFKKADPIIRAEVERREADFHKGIEQYRQAATYAHNVDQALAPFKQTLQNLGLSPEKAITELMTVDHKLRYGSQVDKEMTFAHLAHVYGVNLNSVNQTLQNTDPKVYTLEQQNQQLQRQLQEHQNSVNQQEFNALNNDIESFAADPKHSHFDSVRGHMAALLQAGQAKDLPDAYEQAIYANPVTRAAVLQQQAAAAREEASKKAQAAKLAAGVNIRSRAALPTTQPVTSIEDTIRDEFRRLTGT